MRDRRKHPRNRTYLGGQVVYDQRYCAIDCLVRNVSQAGARLVLAGPSIVPMEFDLVIRQKGQSRRVKLVWRNEADVGVQFLDQQRAGDPLAVEAAQQIRTLKAHNRTLLRRVAELSESTI